MKSLVAAALTLALVAPASATTLLFDFGNTGRQTVGNWNNVVPATTTLFALFDSDGNIYSTSTGQTSFEITDTFFQTGEPSQLGTESPSGDAAGYPVDATDDYFFGHVGPFAGADDNPYGEVKLSNLEPGLAYDFTFFASRTGVGDTREAIYTATGANSLNGTLNASNNDSEVLHLNGITPDGNNEIVIGAGVGPNNDNGNGFFYLGVIQVDVVPEPTSLMLVFSSLGLLAFSRRS